MAIIRTLARLYVSSIDAALADLRRFTDAPLRLRFRYGPLELASVGDLLLIAGEPEVLQPYRSTQVTALTDDLDAVLASCATDGDEVLSGPNDVPTGRNLRVRHASGAVIEYVEWQADKVATIAT